MTTPSRPELDAWIDPAWGQWVHDNLPTVFPSLAAAKAEFPAPRDGQQVFLTDESSLIVGKGGTWRWLQKTFPRTLGNTPNITWNAAIVTAASSFTVFAISGTAVTVQVTATLATPTQSTGSSGIKLATIATALRTTGNFNMPAAPHHSTGAGSGLIRFDTLGSVEARFTTADNPTAASVVSATVAYSVADLIPA